jgi:pyruvate/2-oxoglutarate dehydrogenase complex dihydrolipoamide acyltransferase (E2) component
MFKDFKISYIEKNVNITGTKRLNYLRQCVAYMLTQSANTIPHAAMITHYDVTPVIEYAKTSEKTIRPREGETPEQFRLRRAVRKNYSAFFLKALAHVFAEAPHLPKFMDYRVWRGPGTLYYTDDVNISYTANTKFGVIKPIVRNAHRKTVVQVAEEMRELTRKARRTDANELYRRVAVEYVKCALRELNFKEIKGIWMLLRALLWMRDPIDPEFADVPEDQKLKPSDILGAICTLANNGMMVAGNQTQTIITPPELYMFGISDLHQAAWVVDGQVVPRYVITFFATMDHRALDAGEGFPSFARLGEYFQHPETIYEWEPEKPGAGA